jgi:hypothetical protein
MVLCLMIRKPGQGLPQKNGFRFEEATFAGSWEYEPGRIPLGKVME